MSTCSSPSHDLLATYVHRTATALAWFLFLVIQSAGLHGCQSKEHFFDVTGELLVPSAGEHYDEAARMATEWKGDSYVVRLTADVASSSGAPPTGGHLTYMFESHTSPTEFYVARLAEGTWTSEVASKMAAETSLPIERNQWALDSVDAWNIAMANGGEEFLIEHQEPSTSLDATLLYRMIRRRGPASVGRRFQHPFGT